MNLRRRHAFTLIELLIVIAIIAILFSIGMPAIVKASQRAGEAKCLANIRSALQATVSYLNDNNQVFPTRSGTNALRGSNLFGQEGIWNHPISRTPVTDRPLHSYLNGETGIAECPNDGGSSSRPASIGATDFEYLGSSYNYPDRRSNSQLRHLDGVWAIEGHRLTAVAQPSKKVVLADNTLWTPSEFETNAWHEISGNRVRASGAFVDGHAEVIEAKTDPVTQTGWSVYLYRNPTLLTSTQLEAMARQDAYY